MVMIQFFLLVCLLSSGLLTVWRDRGFAQRGIREEEGHQVEGVVEEAVVGIADGDHARGEGFPEGLWGPRRRGDEGEPGPDQN